MKKYMKKAIKRSFKNAIAIVTTMTFFVPTDSKAFTYTPQWGDTYWDLSQEYGVSVDTLIATNGENLIAGVPIEIPEITLTPVEVYPATTNTSVNNTNTCNYIMPELGDGWYAIAARTWYSVNSLLGANNATLSTPVIYGHMIKLPTGSVDKEYDSYIGNDTQNTSSSNTNGYMPEYGDGWWQISQDTGYSIDSLLRANNATLNTPVIYGVPINLPGSTIIDYAQTYSVPQAERYLGEVTLDNNPWGNSWYNIRLACDMLNGVTVAPWETFSFYEQFPNQGGAADGFLPSIAFGPNGEDILVDGGGLCFVSTLTYQGAVLYCGMIPVERWNHVKDIDYATRGVNDAAVMLNTDRRYRQDMQFTNNTGHTVKFYFTYDWSGSVTVSMYAID
jgi:vancomycin resistance protein YoaR